MGEPSGHLLEQAYESVKKLVEDFRAHERDYLSPNYQESQVREDFINKFFAALGWDVTHERQKNPREYEVQIENRVQIGATQQRADYAFFLAPNFRDPKFYVEAKKPARELKNPDFFYQTLRYGWNGYTPIAILTDFEEFYIIDCRLKPTIKDALSRETKSFRYTDYADEEKFRWIYYLFSHEEVAKGSVEKYAAELSKPKGKAERGGAKSQPVDQVFLAELDGYRESLAKGFKKSNQVLDGEELTEAVQRTIDRLVFIRFLEDKLIEQDKEIVNLIDRQMAWELFIGYCRRLEPKYNGLIFKPHPIIDSENFKAPDAEVFKEICEGLAGRESPYNFAQIPISILGSIYERFLGKVVHATDKRVKVEEKPEVRKAGGVYYTPDYIVRYIVKETVGKLIEGKTPEEISKMAFADIACGSGSFLIEVYDLLLKYHEHYFAEHPEKAKKTDLENREGRKVLSLKKRQEILVNNIYGVDIDYQATEVTQLSLYLKLLEDVTTNDAYQFSLLKEKILPNLSKNIICGNSLIGTDIIDGDLFPGVDESKLKPMNFEDAFPEVMKRGGFDAVVGNPPYSTITDEVEKKYFSERFKGAEGRFDTFELFIEKAILRSNRTGLVGYIVPSPLLTNVFSRKVRQVVLENTSIGQIVNFGMDVFDEPTIHTCIVVLNRFKETESKVLIKKQVNSVEELHGDFDYTLPQSEFMSNSNFVFNIFFDPALGSINKKLLRQSKQLGEMCFIRQCIKTGNDDIYVKESNGPLKAPWKPTLRGRSIGRYATFEKNLYLKYGSWLARNWANESFYETEKIGVRETGNRITATIDEEDRYFLSSLYSIYPKSKDDSHSIKFYLAILNSSLSTYYIRKVALELTKGAFTKVRTNQLAQLPVRSIDFSDSTDKARHDHIVTLVERMLSAKEELSKAKTEAETTRLERECEALDRQIDQAVYELYGLTEEEIKVVENV